MNTAALDCTAAPTISTRNALNVPDVLECASIAKPSAKISKFGWGGPRANSGGRRAGAGRPRKTTGQAIVDIIWTPPAGLRWYVVQVETQLAVDAIAKISDLGFSSWYPREVVLVQRRLRGKTATRTVVRPLFVGYGFVAFDAGGDDWQHIASIRGVRKIFGGEHPTAVPAGVVESLIEKFGSSGIIDRTPAPKLPALKAGEKVRLIGGAFADWSAVVGWSSQKRVQVLLSVMGHQRRLELPRKMVQVA